jgi:hypothetical protein
VDFIYFGLDKKGHNSHFALWPEETGQANKKGPIDGYDKQPR